MKYTLGNPTFNSNVEIKAKVGDHVRMRNSIERISETQREILEQEDVFFETGAGRLKLRIMGPSRGELIFYDRRDQKDPTVSNYVISKTEEPDSLKLALASALAIRGVVRKSRELYFVGRTRIHLDKVEGLGVFLELEFVVDHGQSSEKGIVELDRLMRILNIDERDLVNEAYIDLLLNSRTAAATGGAG